MAFREYINQYLEKEIGEADYAEIAARMRPKQIRRKQYLLQEGEVCKYLSFITRGALRLYRVDMRDHENIVRFGIENWWVFDRESFELGTPSAYNIDAWEDSEVLQISVTDHRELMEQIVPYQVMTLELEKRSQIANQRRLHAAISFTAEERYLELKKTHPVFFERFPQTMIASYLGVSAETLSRVKRQFS